MAESLPIHVLSGPDLMAASMRRLHPDAAAAATRSCTTRPTTATRTPPTTSHPRAGVRRRRRAPLHRARKAHQADCGNAEPTTYSAMARDVYEEGALIFPCVKVQEGYRDIEDVIRMCQVRIRVPEQWWGDYLALLGAARVGEREILALGGGGRLGRARGLRRTRGSTTARGAWRRRSARIPHGERTVRHRTTTRSRPHRPTASRSRSRCASTRRARSRSTCATTPTACRAGST